MSAGLISPQDYLEYLLTHKGDVLAPWIAGCCADLYAAGIYTGMVVRYFTRTAPKDTRKTIALILVVFILSVYKTAAALYILFLCSVTLNGNQAQLAVASLTNWVMVTSPLTTQFVDLAVQSYYVFLLWDIFRIDRGHRFRPAFRWVVFSAIFVLAIIATTMGCLAVAEVLSFRFIKAPEYLSAQLATSFICDAIISIGTIYCILKSDVYSSKNRSTFNKIARLIALSASVPALFALLNVSIVAANLFYNRWHVLFDFALSKAFAISFMWTVEVRRNIRRAETAERNSDAIHTPTPHHFTENFFDSRFAATVHASRLPPDHNPIELGRQRQREGQHHNYDHGRDQDSSGEIQTTMSGRSPKNFLDMKG